MEVDAEFAANGDGTNGMVSDMSNTPFTSSSPAAGTSPASVSALGSALDSIATSPLTSLPPTASLSSSASFPAPPPPHELARQFDLRRPIRTLLPASHQVTIPVRLLNAELTCIICLGVIRSATAVSECLHRFCHSCINASLRHHKKECPQCRVACPSHRNLRKDAMFDHIIASIYPDLEKAQYELEKTEEALIDSAGLSKFAESAVRGAQKQAEDAKHRLAETRRMQEEAKAEEKARRQREENSVYLRLEPLPSSTLGVTLGNISVRTRKQISVDLLRLWIEHKLKEVWREAHQNDMADASGGTSASPAPAPRVGVSIWCRWSEMSDVSRQLWMKVREPTPPPPPPAPTIVAATNNGADSNSLVIRLPKFPPTSPPTPCTYNGDHDDATPSTTQPASTATPAASSAATNDRMQDGELDSTTSRKRKRPGSRAADDVAGFVPHELARSDYCQLGNRTPLRTLPSAVLDDSRLMGGRSGGGSGARRITLLYQADEVDENGQLVKKLAVAAAKQQPNGTAASHSATASPAALHFSRPLSSDSSPPSPQFTPALPSLALGEEDDRW